MTEATELEPLWSCPPGATIEDLLEERSIALTEFASALEMTIESANDLILGRLRIDQNIAVRVSDYLGASPSFWLSREQQFRKDRERNQQLHQKQREQYLLKTLPLADMAKFKWIPDLPSSRLERLKAVYAFFGVTGFEEWSEFYTDVVGRAAFRSSKHPSLKVEAVAAWLRQGEIQANQVRTKRWSAEKFRHTLSDLRKLTKAKDPESFLPILQDKCAGCGVAVEIVRAPSGCGVSGATRFLSPSKSLIQLSFRYLSDDQFWFTFFHEAAHLLLHGENIVFIDEDDSPASSREEQEANDFAARLLIPLEYHEELLKLRNRANEIIRFAVKVGISPGIVVGQLQHYDVLAPNQGNSLKRRFKWESIDGRYQVVSRERR